MAFEHHINISQGQMHNDLQLSFKQSREISKKKEERTFKETSLEK
jgi:hypothetical protein